MRDLRCGTWDLSLRYVGSFVAVRGLSSCDAQALELTGPRARGLSCPAACGITVPASPALEGGLLTTGPPGKSLAAFLKL